MCDNEHMKRNSIEQQQQPISFDLGRVTHAKREVNISTSTLRTYNQRGLRFYKVGKCTFYSKSELAHFIREQALGVAPTIHGHSLVLG